MATRPSARVTAATHRQGRGAPVLVIGMPPMPHPQALISRHGLACPDVDQPATTAPRVHLAGGWKYPLCAQRGLESCADLPASCSGSGQWSRSASQHVQALVILLLVDLAPSESVGQKPCRNGPARDRPIAASRKPSQGAHTGKR